MIVTESNLFDIVAALHNETRPVGMGFVNATGPITADDARADLGERVRNGRIRLDYYRGRPLKVLLQVGEEVNLRLFDRDAGVGAGERALRVLENSNG